jgi:hypothetical protein
MAKERSLSRQVDRNYEQIVREYRKYQIEDANSMERRTEIGS